MKLVTGEQQRGGISVTGMRFRGGNHVAVGEVEQVDQQAEFWREGEELREACMVRTDE